MRLDRRTFLKTSACAASVGTGLIWPGRSQAAEFTYKLGLSQPPTHPITQGLQAACADILRESKERLDIKVFPSSQLGSDTDMISQVRSGALEFFTTAGLIWGTLVPVASLSVVGFAFPDYGAVWSAMDGELGAHIRSAFDKVNLVVQSKMWDHGFRQITASGKPINTPKDLAAFKIRTPVSPMLVSSFKALGASPTSMNLTELYTSLQTKVVDGQENPLSVVETAKLYEVQKYCSLTSHAWDGFWLVANKRTWNKLPDDLRKLASEIFDAHATKQREANATLNASLADNLKGRGMIFNEVDRKPFRDALQQAGFYTEWKGKVGPEAWGLLEKYSGPLT
jgi:tripartite ATP-independent transporter DctP family solute receptor